MDSFTTIDVPQGTIINNFKNAKQKLLKTSAAIWFNEICGINQLIPKYIQIKLKYNNQQDFVHLVGEIN
jgi:hypothetical protein